MRENQFESRPVGANVKIALHAGIKDATATDALLRCNGQKKEVHLRRDSEQGLWGRGCAVATNLTAALLKASYQMTEGFLLWQRRNDRKISPTAFTELCKICDETLVFTWLGLALHGDCDGFAFSCEAKTKRR